MTFLAALRDFLLCALGHDPLLCDAGELAELRDASIDAAAEVEELHRQLAELRAQPVWAANVRLAHRLEQAECRAEQAEVRCAAALQALDERRRAG